MKKEHDSDRSVNPHDRFFKYLMRVVENVAELITASFPEMLVKSLDLSTLKNVNGSYESGKSRNYKADMVYECAAIEPGEITITLLFEHKSYVEKMHFICSC